MFRFTITADIAAAIARLEALRAEADRRGPLPRVWIGRTRRDLEAEATAASVRLEGVSVTADEARRILVGDKPAEVSGADAAEAVGYRDAMALVLSRADDPAFVWQRELVLAIHREVLGASFAAEAGRLRSTQNRLASRATGAQVFLPPPAADVPSLLDALCEHLAHSAAPAPVASALAPRKPTAPKAKKKNNGPARRRRGTRPRKKAAARPNAKNTSGVQGSNVMVRASTMMSRLSSFSAGLRRCKKESPL